MELTFKQIESVFMARFAISADREAAFRSRLQHLQRRKMFADLNTGRGTKASYQWNHVIQLMVTLDLIDLGMTPDSAVSRVTRYSDQIIDAVRMVVLGFRSRTRFVRAIQNCRCPFGNTRLIFTSAAVLSFDRSQNGADGQESEAEFLFTLDSKAFYHRLGDDAAVEPAAALIDLGSRMMLVANLIGREVLPNAQATADDLEQWLERWANQDSLS